MAAAILIPGASSQRSGRALQPRALKPAGTGIWVGPPGCSSSRSRRHPCGASAPPADRQSTPGRPRRNCAAVLPRLLLLPFPLRLAPPHRLALCRSLSPLPASLFPPPSPPPTKFPSPPPARSPAPPPPPFALLPAALHSSSSSSELVQSRSRPLSLVSADML